MLGSRKARPWRGEAGLRTVTVPRPPGARGGSAHDGASSAARIRGAGGASTSATSASGAATRSGRAGSAPAVAECPRGRFPVVDVCEWVVGGADEPGRSAEEPSRLEPDEGHPASTPDVPADELAAAEEPELSRICASKGGLVRKRHEGQMSLHQARRREAPPHTRVWYRLVSPRELRSGETVRSMRRQGHYAKR